MIITTDLLQLHVATPETVLIALNVNKSIIILARSEITQGK